MKRQLLTVILLCVGGLLFAQAPTGYYNNAYNKQGHALRVALHQIIKSHTSLSYSALWDAYYTTDVRPDNGKVWDIYSDNPGGTTAYYYTLGSNQCGNYNSEGDCYNREHSVPKSWFNDASPMYTDLFHLYPTDGYVNGRRGNLPLGEVGSATWTSTNNSKLGTCITPGYSNTVFEPNNAYKGDLARTYFYMAVCYMDKNLGAETQSMFTGGDLKPWALAMLLRWHHDDPVSQKEINRNNAVYALQNNRNPFIDFPELVDRIFGSDTMNAFNPNAVEDWTLADRWMLFPNPVNDVVTLLAPMELQEMATVQLWNLTGQLLRQETWTMDGERYTLNVSDLPAGVYTVSCLSDKGRVVKKFVKM